jgi:hypothetical protein
MIVRVSRAGARLYMIEPGARATFPPERLAAFTSFGAFLQALLDERPEWHRRLLDELDSTVAAEGVSHQGGESPKVS